MTLCGLSFARNLFAKSLRTGLNRVNRPLFAGDPEVRILGMEKNKCGNRYSPEVRERAARIEFDHQGEFDSQSAVTCSLLSPLI